MTKSDLRRLLLGTLSDLKISRVWNRQVSVAEGHLRIGAESIQLGDYDRVAVFALGKAASPLAVAMGTTLRAAGCLFEGLAVTLDSRPIPGFRVMVAPHPVADSRSVAAARAARILLTPLGPRDLVIFLVSGGGSAMLEEPIADTLSLDRVCEVGRVLATGCWPILRMNATRCALSAVKGGALAAMAAPARQMTIVVSDVPVGLPEAVASGPSLLPSEVPEPLFDDPEFRRRASVEVLDWWQEQRGAASASDDAMPRGAHHVLLDSDDAVTALEERLVGRGLRVTRCHLQESATVTDTADALLAALAEAGPGDAVISAGECLSPVLGTGRGGRNQALMLALVPRLAGTAILAASVGTDGIDGNSPAAGAVADGRSLARADAAGLDVGAHTRSSDSYRFFDALGDGIVTGATGQNLRDLRVLVVAE